MVIGVKKKSKLIACTEKNKTIQGGLRGVGGICLVLRITPVSDVLAYTLTASLIGTIPMTAQPSNERNIMRSLILALLLLSSMSLVGCEQLKGLLKQYMPSDADPEGQYQAELTIKAGDKEYKYACIVDPSTKTLSNCKQKD